MGLYASAFVFDACLLEHSHGADGSRQVEKRAGTNKRRQAHPYVHEVSDPGVRDVIIVPDVPSRQSGQGIRRTSEKGGREPEDGISNRGGVAVCRRGYDGTLQPWKAACEGGCRHQTPRSKDTTLVFMWMSCRALLMERPQAHALGSGPNGRSKQSFITP